MKIKIYTERDLKRINEIQEQIGYFLNSHSGDEWLSNLLKGSLRELDKVYVYLEKNQDTSFETELFNDGGLPDPDKLISGSDEEAFLLGLYTDYISADLKSQQAKDLRIKYEKCEDLIRMMDVVLKLKTHFENES